MDILDFPGRRPFRDGGNLLRGHPEAVRRQDIPQILAGGDAELAFWKFTEESGLPESPEDFAHVICVLGLVVGGDKYVVQVNNNVNVE